MMLRSRYMRPAARSCLLAAALLLGSAAGAVSHANEREYDSRIGVFIECLSIRNDALDPGTPVTIIRFNSEEEPIVSGDTHDRRFSGKIVAKTESAEHCLPEIEERKLRDDADEFTLYVVAPVTAGGLDSIEIGIGIVGIAPNDTKPIDLDGNGAVDTFAEFSSLGSLIYDVWSGAPFWGEPLWTGYYVFGHGPEGEDADCNCQSDEAIGPSQPPAPPSDSAP
jgi:hypothetical protein